MDPASAVEVDKIYIYRIVDTTTEAGQEHVGTIQQGDKLVKIILVKIVEGPLLISSNDRYSGANN